MSLQDIEELEDNIPEGFHLQEDYDGALTIHYKRTGMGCMNVFLMVWLAGWTVGCVMLLKAYLTGDTMDDGDAVPLFC